MKKKIIIISLTSIILLSIIGFILTKTYHKYQIKNAIIIVELKENLSTEFLSKVKVSDFITNINGTIIDDYEIDTKTIGPKKVSFTYLNDDKIKINQEFTITVVDTTAPVIWLGGSYSVTKGSKDDLTSKILCGDNYDSNPKCEIIGNYDMNEVGTYPLTFKATDTSGNTTEKNFNLYVKKPVTNSGGSNNNQQTVTYFKDIDAKHKNENTEIGLDLSEWQGDVDFNKLKEAGVEFVILRVGSTRGINGDYFLDSKFEQNITRANEAGIPVGIYFYSYANTKEKAIKDAKWILDQIKDYQVDLPVAFDWENWSF